MATTRCCIALGGNLGQVRDHFCQALRGIAQSGRVVAVSRLFRTAPVPAGATSDFLNAAAVIETDIAPEALLDRLQALELAAGRTRETQWGPRTLDLDLILYGSAIVSTPRLTVPHPDCWFRRFVLDPLADVAPDFVHPEKGVPIRGLRERLLPRPMIVAFAGENAPKHAAAAPGWFPGAAPVQFRLWTQPAPVPRPQAEPTFIVWCGQSAGPATDAPARQGRAADERGFDGLPRVPRIAPRQLGLPLRDFITCLLDAAQGEVVPITESGAWWNE